ncbi:hypothetical protein INS49_013401 [Diaporthe citri]|uniref:uncharacterized protein n=1 Tax=Diaporthe citri TaxID=83186 RepID=UPI001C7F80DA|nr:uncharacterized protein INS49_013401 [Diaporthe citri]KAG6357524.1 hypothetical protein INS49_013401 [Diaporthe citri]
MQSTLLASWYREPGFYQLERRAIFSKSWIMISHSCQFDERGKYARYEMAGYRFFSYSMNGNLAKAPRFDQVEGFKKEDYKLYKVHTHIDDLGFLWVNLDAAETPTFSWEEQFGVARFSRFSWLMAKLTSVHSPIFFYTMSIVPTSATTSLMRYEVYRSKTATPEQLKEKLDFIAQVEGEDKCLANGAQGNLNSDTYTTGPFHPDVEGRSHLRSESSEEGSA